MSPSAFRQLTDPLPEPMLLIGADGSVKAANRAFGTQFGAPGGRVFADLVGDPGEIVSRFLNRCRGTGTLTPTVLHLFTKTAEGVAPQTVECQVSGARLRPDQEEGAGEALVLLRLIVKANAPSKFVALNERIGELNSEIVARRRLEVELRESEEWLRVTLASIAEGVIVTDADGRIKSINRAAAEWVGWDPGEAVGKPVSEVWQTLNDRTHEPLDPVGEVLRSGSKVSSPPEGTLLIRRCADPAEPVQQLQIEPSAAPIKAEDGATVGAVLVFRDVSDRHKNELRLRQLNERLRFTLKATGVGRWFNELPLGDLNWDARTREIFWVPPGVAPTVELFFERLHPDDREATREAMEHSIASGETYDIEHRVIDPESGAVRWVRSQGMPSFHDDGTPSRFDGINYDITPQKASEAELRTIAAELSEANRMKNDFLALLAHELRNPLAPLRTGLEILRLAEQRETDPALRERTRTMMERQVVQLVALIDDLMDVSRISRGKLVLKRKQVNLQDVLRGAIEESMPAIDEKGHSLVRNIPEEPIFLFADPHRLTQVFSNLLNNAASYTPAGGRIELTATLGESEIEVSIKDSGMGIAAEKQEEVFEMFTQIDRKTQGGYAGLGIGLTLVRSLVDMHGGSVAVASEGAGKGSEFTVSIPGVSEESDVSHFSPEDGEVAECEKRRVLVVDDNPAAASSLATMVSMLGHDVRVAHEGKEAVRVAREYKPDVILMDLGMPVMSGYEAARFLRNENPTEPLLVAVSGWGAQANRERAIEAGFDHHLVKPANPAEIRRLIALGQPRTAQEG
ncbi:MAG: ATP-binding protein [Luteolibacter sp.]